MTVGVHEKMPRQRPTRCVFKQLSPTQHLSTKGARLRRPRAQRCERAHEPRQPRQRRQHVSPTPRSRRPREDARSGSSTDAAPRARTCVPRAKPTAAPVVVGGVPVASYPDFARSHHFAPSLPDLLLQAYRVFHGVSEGVPGVTIDKYGDTLFVQSWRNPIVRAPPLRAFRESRDATRVSPFPPRRTSLARATLPKP